MNTVQTSLSKYGTVLDESFEDLGLTENTSLQKAVTISNGQNINREYSRNIDTNNQFVGWEQQVSWNPYLNKLFSKETIKTIQQKVCEYLEGVDDQGRKIIPTERVVENALYGVFNNNRPQTGDIYGKYTVVNDNSRDDYSYVVDQTISLLVRGIRNETEMRQNNSKLTIWTTLFGDFNEHGLRQYAPIKVRNKRPDTFLFHMRY
jgi:hypothetical protein